MMEERKLEDLIYSSYIMTEDEEFRLHGMSQEEHEKYINEIKLGLAKSIAQYIIEHYDELPIDFIGRRKEKELGYELKMKMRVVDEFHFKCLKRASQKYDKIYEIMHENLL